MRPAIIVVLCMFLAGCTTLSIGNYIKAEHPYNKKIYGRVEQIVQVVHQVMEKNGYKAVSESFPSVYERSADARKETPNDVLLFSKIREHHWVLFSSYTHLNVYVRAEDDGADIEVRFGKVTSTWISQFQGSRNDKLCKGLLDQIERAMLVR